MVLLSVFAVSAIAYALRKKEDQDPAFDTTGKTELDLLPFETDLLVFEAPIVTITYFDGNVEAACEYLKERIDEIVKLNPWLGGWLHPKDGSVRLYYDEEGTDLAPGLFGVMEPGEVEFSRDTNWNEIEGAFEGKGITVKPNAELIGENEPLWRVCVIPDMDSPDSRFALVVSMAHMAGDAYTYYRILNMLDVETSMVGLNPKRHLEFTDAIQDVMGAEEADYLKNAKSNPLFDAFKSEKAHYHMFYVSDSWLEEQELLWSKQVKGKLGAWVDKVKARRENSHRSCWSPFGSSSSSSSQSCWNPFKTSTPQPAIIEAETATREAPRDNHSRASIVMWLRRMTGEENQDSAATRNQVSSPSINSIIVSWFWKKVDANVGLMAINHRDRPYSTTTTDPLCSTDDAGNYINPIPYTPTDYQTPSLIDQSLPKARRVGADRILNKTKLTGFTWDATYSFSSNWSSLHEGKLDFGLDDVEQKGHHPFFNATFLRVIPSTLSIMVLYTAGPNKELGAYVVAPKSVIDKIDTSGIVKESIAKF